MTIRARSCELVPRASPDETRESILAALAGRRFDYAGEVAVLDGGALVGLIPLERLLGAPEGALARELMDADPPVVGPAARQERAAWKAVQHGESSLAVVDEAGRFMGLVPPRRLLLVLLAEHHEDMTRLAGLLKGALAAKAPLQEALPLRLWHRLPWLAVGLAGALGAAEIVSWSEGRLRAEVALAFFLPGVVYLADAVGTQTETLVVRGLSVGLPMARVAVKELLTGLALGAGLGAVAAPLALWRWGDPRLAWLLGCSLFATCSIAAVVAVILPAALARAGQDPAFGSGPLATVIQDLLSILIYLAIAGLFF